MLSYNLLKLQLARLLGFLFANGSALSFLYGNRGGMAPK